MATTKILPDQFMIENLSAYSGSYSDHYMYGNIASVPHTYIEGSSGGKTYGMLQCYPAGYTSSVDFRRSEIAFSTQANSDEIRKSIALQNKTMWLSDYIQLVYGRYLPSRTANYAAQFNDESEFFYDSFTPNLFQMYKINGGNYASNTVGDDPAYPYGTWSEVQFCDHYSGSRKNLASGEYIEDFSYPYISNSLAIVLTNLGTHYNAAAGYPYSGVDDTQWRLNYPYSIKYKALGRSLKVSRELQYPITTNVNVAGSATLDPLSSNIVGTVAIFTSGTALEPATGTSFTPDNSQNLQFLSDMVISGSEGEYLYSGLSTNLSVIQTALNRKTVSKITDIQNIFFCLGDYGTMNTILVPTTGIRTRNFPNFLVNSYFVTMAPSIRGYKYGIYKANAASTKAYWRRDHYGQFRDRLEQRQYSKFYYNGMSDLSPDPSRPVLINKVTERSGKGVLKNIIGQAPVTITFAPGSQAYLTASQYKQFDPNLQLITYLSNSRESGIYDFEYRSSIPFEDRDV